MYVQPSKHGLATLNCPLNLTSGLTKKREKCKSVYLCFPYNFLKGIENVISSDPLKKYWDV